MATRKQPERRPKGTSFAKRALRAVGNTISRHPSIAGGVVAGAVIFGYVAMNAMYQPGKHPSPWFVTRDDSVRQVAAVRQAVPVPENTVTTFKIERADAPAPVSDTQDTLVAQLQEALRARGIYDGIADGVAGPQTREAIRGYQVQSGLEPTGEPTDALLVHILITNLESVATPQGRPEPEALTIPRPSSLTPAESGSDLILDIQTGLSNIAYADIKVDGIAGEQTRAAIADFQKHYRLPVTGKPDSAVLEKLKEIGAL